MIRPMTTTVALLLCGAFLLLVSASTGARTIRLGQIGNGAWVGEEVGRDNPATLYVRGDKIVFVDKEIVYMGRWTTRVVKTEKGGRTIQDVDAAINGIFEHDGSPYRPKGMSYPMKTLIKLALDGSHLEFCGAQPGSGKPRPEYTNKREPGTRCFSFQLHRTGLHQCVSKCRSRNKARSVPFEVIDRDCRAECLKKK